MKKITAIALGEEVEKKIQNKEGLSDQDETSIKFLKKKAINCIPLANENRADFDFIFNPPAGQFIVIAGKGD